MGYSIHPNDPAAKAQDFEEELNRTCRCTGILGRLFGHKVRRVQYAGRGWNSDGTYSEGYQPAAYETRCVRCGIIQRDSRSNDPGHRCSPYSAIPQLYV